MSRFQIAAFAIFIAIAGCKNTPIAHSRDGFVSHVVVCWLKSPGNEEDRHQLIEVSKGFKDIAGVVDVFAGSVLPSDRPIVVSDFDLAIVMTFESEEAMQDYLKHPEHQKAVSEKLQPLTQKILVYDFIIE